MSRPLLDSPAWRISLVAGLLILTGWWLLRPGDDGILAEIQRRGSLRVGLDASFPPFESIDDQGRIVGFDVDLARAIAADLGVEVEVVNIGFDGLYDALLARRADLIISGLPYDPRWTRDVAYTINYFNAGQVLLTPAGSALQSVEALAGQRVAVEWGSQADMEARRLERELPGLSLIRRPSAAEALATLSQNQADAAIVDGVSAHSATASGLRRVTYLTDEWYVAAVHIESQALLEAANQTLLRLQESGQLARLQARWLAGE